MRERLVISVIPASVMISLAWKNNSGGTGASPRISKLNSFDVTPSRSARASTPPTTRAALARVLARRDRDTRVEHAPLVGRLLSPGGRRPNGLSVRNRAAGKGSTCAYGTLRALEKNRLTTPARVLVRTWEAANWEPESRPKKRTYAAAILRWSHTLYFSGSMREARSVVPMASIAGSVAPVRWSPLPSHPPYSPHVGWYLGLGAARVGCVQRSWTDPSTQRFGT